MMIRISRRAALLVVLLSVMGCETTGGANQIEATVYDIHRRVSRLDQNLESSITKLNETTAELINRVNESDEQTRRMKTIVEENQVKIDNLDRSLNELKTVLYQHFNLTPPSAGGVSMPPVTGETGVGNVVIEPPRPVTVPQEDSAPLESVGITPPVTPPGGSGAVPGDPKVMYESIQRTFANEQYQEALTQYNAFLAAYPNAEDSHNAQFWKAKCYFKLGQYQESATEFQRLRDTFPNSTKVPFAMHNQAMAFSRLGQTAQAEQLLNDLIQNYPFTPAAEQAKVDLQTLQGR